MSVVNEAVEDGVAEGGIADDVMPVLDGELAGDERRAATVAVVEDLEEVTALCVVEGHHPEVIELCEPSHKSIHVQHLVMWSESASSRGSGPPGPKDST